MLHQTVPKSVTLCRFVMVIGPIFLSDEDSSLLAVAEIFGTVLEDCKGGLDDVDAPSSEPFVYFSVRTLARRSAVVFSKNSSFFFKASISLSLALRVLSAFRTLQKKE